MRLRAIVERIDLHVVGMATILAPLSLFWLGFPFVVLPTLLVPQSLILMHYSDIEHEVGARAYLVVNQAVVVSIATLAAVVSTWI